MKNFLTDALANIGCACVVVLFLRDLIAIRKSWRLWDDRLGYAFGNALLAVSNALRGDWLLSAVFAAVAICFAISWWRRRRKRRALAALGAKARARIAAMVGTIRERARPRRVLKPQRSPA